MTDVSSAPGFNNALACMTIAIGAGAIRASLTGSRGAQSSIGKSMVRNLINLTYNIWVECSPNECGVDRRNGRFMRRESASRICHTRHHGGQSRFFHGDASLEWRLFDT